MYEAGLSVAQIVLPSKYQERSSFASINSYSHKMGEPLSRKHVALAAEQSPLEINRNLGPACTGENRHSQTVRRGRI